MNDHYRVEMTGVRKSFAGVKALKGVDFRLRPGEIHALVGENGAGKSTLMKVLAGTHAMDDGTIRIDGKAVVIGSPRRGKELGVGIVYQEFELADDLTVAENIFIDRLGRNGIVRWRKLYAAAEKVLGELGFDLDARSLVCDISVAYKQVVEIAKALSANTRILILDEPTAVLTPRETEKLFATLRTLKQGGVSIVYISHRMDEVFSLCDSVTIMRDGEVTGDGRIEDFTIDDMVEAMIGRKLSNMYPRREPVIGEEVLRLEKLSGGGFRDISLNVRRGEIVGIFGLVGSGRTEVARAIFGADATSGGKVFIDGGPVRVHSPHQGVGKGLALIPENRKEQGLVLDMPIRCNITLTNINDVSWCGVILGGRERAVSQKLSQLLTVKSDDLDNPADSLSGGNQQKVVIAKWLNTGAKVLVMDEPTRGVDVGAKAEIYSIINELAGRGVGVIMISSELNEIIGMCDRVVVMDNGRVRGELPRDEMSEKSIMKLVVGG